MSVRWNSLNFTDVGLKPGVAAAELFTTHRANPGPTFLTKLV